MIVSLIGAASGLLSALIPEILKYFQQKQDNAHELAVLQLQTQQAAGHDASQNRAIGLQSDADTLRAQMASVQAIVDASLRPTGSKFIDTWNAAIRPLTISFMLAIFVLTVGIYAGYIIDMMLRGELQPSTAVGILWDNDMISGSMQGAIGWVFGYRAFAKAAGK